MLSTIDSIDAKQSKIVVSVPITLNPSLADWQRTEIENQAGEKRCKTLRLGVHDNEDKEHQGDGRQNLSVLFSFFNMFFSSEHVTFSSARKFEVLCVFLWSWMAQSRSGWALHQVSSQVQCSYAPFSKSPGFLVFLDRGVRTGFSHGQNTAK
jgi:hypothetical protein